VLLKLNEHDLLQSLHSGSHIFELKVANGADETVLVKEVQYDSMGDRIVHIDFIRVSLTEKVEVEVPIVTTGIAIGAVHKGVVDQPLKELEISCLPTEIPGEIRVAINQLDIGMMLHVADLKLPQGVTALNDPEQVVVTVHPPAVEEEEVPEEVEGAAAEPEVIGAKPEEGEEEGSAEE
jgi:large subunit ribosomal protein L25